MATTFHIGSELSEHDMYQGNEVLIFVETHLRNYFHVYTQFNENAVAYNTPP
jgi:hypothetical protein